MNTSPVVSQRLLWPGPAIVAVAAFAAVVCAIDPGGDYPRAPQGPGLTLDEPFNVQQGVMLVEAIGNYKLGLLHPDSVREVFGNPRIHLADHPPLGRVWIGLFHNATRWLFPPVETATSYSVACARTAPAAAFAITVFLVGWIAAHWCGQMGGISAAVALVLMPRVFGHAHLASLESFIGLFYAAAVLCIAVCWRPSLRAVVACGVLFGLALLTKIQAILLPIPVAIWALACWRRRAVVPLLAWGIVAFAVFFALWPWLWLAPLDHLAEYFGRVSARQPVKVWYFGADYLDVDVPWHYPAVMFLTTVPAGLLLLGFVGLFARGRSEWRNAREWLVFLCMGFPLFVFSLPRVAVYDGERLFLVSFPLWAIFVGRGAAWVAGILRRKWSPAAAAAVVSLFLAAQAAGIATIHPCYLSYYNALVGGLKGADALGLEANYWGDGVTRAFLDSCVRVVPQGARIESFPVLHPAQLESLERQSPILRRHGVTLAPYQGIERMQTPYLMIFRRRADLPDPINGQPPRSRVLAEVRRCGVQLAALYEIDPPSR
jgi:hypothetical protein